MKSLEPDLLELRDLVENHKGDRVLRDQPRLVSRYHDAITRLYEFGWGQSFHFAPRCSGEDFLASLRRYEKGIGDLLGLGPDVNVADFGCGVAGPLVTIAKATGANITGINLNAYQIGRGQRALRRAGLQDTCSLLRANYMDVPLDDGSFDAAYAIEAICHSPDRVRCFEEIHRLLRPGGELALADWCMTESFDENDPVHRDIRDRIEFTSATPNLPTTSQQVEAVRAAGFEILAIRDKALDSDVDTPWYRSLQSRDFSLASLARIPAGRWFTAKATGLIERLRIVPTGTSECASILNQNADALVAGGIAGIFTPCFLVHARRPGGPA